MEQFCLRGARLIDPVSGLDRYAQLWVDGDRIGGIAETCPEGIPCIRAEGCLLTPPLIDLHVHLREPGGEEAETLASGLRAAVAGGFGAVVAMPNTRPPMDHPERIEWARREAEKVAAGVELWPTACLTRGRDGREVADLEALAAAGAVAFTDDGTTPVSEAVFREALQRAAALGLPVLDHAEDPELERRGVLHEGRAARRFGLPGIPSEAETRIVERDVRLAAETGARLHVQHVSSAGAVAIIRQARARGLPVTAEVTPHHLALCEDDIPSPDPNYKMNPPLRSAEDRRALIEAVLEGTVNCLATDHAPHTAAAKGRGWLAAPPGVVGLETAVGITWTVLVERHGMPVIEWVRRWTAGPASVLRRETPSLRPGGPADLLLIDVSTEWVVDPNRFLSRSRNTPFAGWRPRGRPVAMWRRGRRVWALGEWWNGMDG